MVASRNIGSFLRLVLTLQTSFQMAYPKELFQEH